MITFAEITDLVAELKDGDHEPEAALAQANTIADKVVALITARTNSTDPVDEVLGDVADAAAQAHLGYEAARTQFERGSVESDALILIGGYWEMRRAAAALEASVVRDRKTTLAAVPAAKSTGSPFATGSVTKSPVVTPAGEVAHASPGFGPLGPEVGPTTKPGDTEEWTATPEVFTPGTQTKLPDIEDPRPRAGVSIGDMSRVRPSRDSPYRLQQLQPRTRPHGEATMKGISEPTTASDTLARIRALRTPPVTKQAPKEALGDDQ